MRVAVTGCGKASRQACSICRGTLEPAATAVDAIAQHRMAEVLEVQADLMLAAGLEGQFEQGAGRAEPLADHEVRDRRQRRLAASGQPPPAGGVGVGDRCVDGAGVVGRSAHDQRDVLPVEGVRAEQLATGLMRFARQRHRQRARGVAVEPVQWPDVAAPAAPPFHVFAHPVQHRVLVGGSSVVGADRQQPRRLVEDQHVLVLVEPVEA